MLTAKEIEEKYGLSPELLDELERDAAAGNLPGIPSGPIVVGRPLLFGEKLKSVTFKEPESKVSAIDARAKSLSMSRSDYLRWLVDSDLASA